MFAFRNVITFFICITCKCTLDKQYCGHISIIFHLKVVMIIRLSLKYKRENHQSRLGHIIYVYLGTVSVSLFSILQNILHISKVYPAQTLRHLDLPTNLFQYA